jgi:large subunit ribosomal protein L25
METKAKKLRREGFVVGNLFGKEIEGSIPIQIDQKEAERLYKSCLKGSQLFLELEGKQYDVLLKDVQYDGMKQMILEMEFQALVQGEKVRSVSEVVLHNKDKVTEGILEQLLKEVAYKALPENILNQVDVDCGDLKLGDSITVGDLDIAKNGKIEISTPLDTVVVTVIAAKNSPIEEEAPAEGEETEQN